MPNSSSTSPASPILTVRNAFFERYHNDFKSDTGNSPRPISELPLSERPASKVDGLEEAARLAADKSYAELFRSQKLLNTELETLVPLLSSLKELDREPFLLYAYYCGCMLESFYLTYGDSSKAEKIKQIKLRLEILAGKKKPEPRVDKTHLEEILDNLTDYLLDLAKTPFHLHKIKDKISWANLYRIYYLFNLFSIKEGLLLVKDLQAMIKGFKASFDIDQVFDLMQKPAPVTNVLSIALFLMRFLINAANVIRRFLKPNGLNQDASKLAMLSPKDKISPWESLAYEAREVALVSINDLFWPSVNGITNYASIFRIPLAYVGWILVPALGFDVGMLSARIMITIRQYNAKLREYENARTQVDIAFTQEGDEKKKRFYKQQRDLLDKQIKIIELEKKTMVSTYAIMTLGASLLMAGFTGSLLVHPPALLLVCFLVCIAGIAIYMSEGAIKNLFQTLYELEQAQDDVRAQGHTLGFYKSEGKQLSPEQIRLMAKQKAYTAARNDLIFTMVKNTVVPALIIGTFIVCWQAALVMTAIYLGFEVLHYLNKKRDTGQAEALQQEAECRQLAPA